MDTLGPAEVQAVPDVEVEEMVFDVANFSVEEIMNRWPNTLAIFIEYRMLCVGCAVASFHTVAEACAEHGLDEALVCAELDRLIIASGVCAAQ